MYCFVQSGKEKNNYNSRDTGIVLAADEVGLLNRMKGEGMNSQASTKQTNAQPENKKKISVWNISVEPMPVIFQT